MFALLGYAIAIAYHFVSGLAGLLAPALGGLAAAAAIVAFTMAVRLLLLPLSYCAMRGQLAQARLAPRIAELRRRYPRQPDRLQRELAALYVSEGTGMLSGCLPFLLQAPFLSVMYLLFRSSTIAGKPNDLLGHTLFGASLGSHWLSGTGPLSGQGAVFAGVFALIALIGWAHGRIATRSTAPAPDGPTGRGQNRAAAARPAGAFGLLTRLMPYLTLAVAAFLPLSAGLYLATTAGWTLAERVLLRRKLSGWYPRRRRG